MCTREVAEDAAPPHERPPVVQKNLQRTPQRDPAAYRQALAHDGKEGPGRRHFTKRIGEQQARREKSQADGETDTTL